MEHQLRETTKHFEEKIAGAFCQQKRLADEKLRAVACKAMAHTARDVVGDEQQRRGEQLRGQLRRRRRELRQSVAGYLRKARQLLEVVGSDEKVQREAQDNDYGSYLSYSSYIIILYVHICSYTVIYMFI